MKQRYLMMFAMVATMLAALAIAGPSFAGAINVMNVNVNHGITGNGVDQPFGGVQVCVPGSTTKCQIITGLLIDTGSYGLRIFSQALTIHLPSQTSGPDAIAECAFFGSLTTWGRVATADVTMGSEPTISNLPVQIINPNFPSVGHRPAACNQINVRIAANPQQENFNGILGVGLFQSDCPACVSSTPRNGYYACTSTTCTRTMEPLALQVQNPVALLPVDNNGVLLHLPPPPPTGAPSLTGQLIFGVNTTTNNQIPGTFKVFTADPATLTFKTKFQKKPLVGFIDSGSNGFFYQNSSLPLCPGAPWYCPAGMTGQSATNVGSDGITFGVVDFNIANAFGLFLSGNAAFSNLGADVGGGVIFDWGLPFFLGRKVFVGIAGKSIAGVPESTPLWAYK